jgi:hypothetical protein
VSFDALAWAAKQNTGSSGTKLVLLGLAECASRGQGLAFPSIAELVEFSSLDRKSVMGNLDKLEEGGFITDTGRRVGRTGQIKVYQVNVQESQNRDTSQTVPKAEPLKSTAFPPKSTENGTRNKSEPVSVAKATGAADLAKQLFDIGVELLAESERSPKEARSLIGMWRKDHGDGKVLAALLDCQNRAISDPVEWLQKRLGGVKYVSASGYEYRGDLDAVIREAERRADWGTYWAAKTARDQAKAA